MTLLFIVLAALPTGLVIYHTLTYGRRGRRWMGFTMPKTPDYLRNANRPMNRTVRT